MQVVLGKSSWFKVETTYIIQSDEGVELGNVQVTRPGNFVIKVGDVVFSTFRNRGIKEFLGFGPCRIKSSLGNIFSISKNAVTDESSSTTYSFEKNQSGRMIAYSCKGSGSVIVDLEYGLNKVLSTGEFEFILLLFLVYKLSYIHDS